MFPLSLAPLDRTERRLLILAGLFLTLYAAALTLAPAVRARSWEVAYRWDHWLGVLAWLLAFILLHTQSARWLPDRDPYLLPVAALLSGWGMLTIWRLLPGFGMRQALWLLVASGVLVAGLRLPTDLGFLRRYKYLWLTGSLLLTALTLFFGTNPLGYGPRMWLGCCGVYFQPSEPLKLLLIAYLAAYLADRQHYLVLSRTKPLSPSSPPSSAPAPSRPRLSTPLLPILGPTLIMTGLALALLLVQRDLGTASIFLFLYAVIVYIASGRKRVLLIAVLGMLAAGVVGYRLFDVVRVRVDAWLNPWLDPSGRSYQIVQSLLAVANGGFLGRGPGVGNPSLVPVSHSDLIYAAIAEEHGLLGTTGLLLLMACLAIRGLRAALNAPDTYRRYLAAGLTTYLVGQGLLIISGSLRLLPLTGVTLPFVSYGGSSLLTSFLSLLLLLHISNRHETVPAALPDPRLYLRLGAFLLGGLAAAALATGWWAMLRGPNLLTRTDNPRRAIDDRWVRRGSIFDRRNDPINASYGNPGEYARLTLYPDLSNIVGYTNPTYGQSGLEASLDEYLRGLRGNPGLSIWWNHVLYGQPPPGLDVRLSLDLKLQRAADQLLGDRRSALVMLNPQDGEILVMASHPTFDANSLDEHWDSLIQDPGGPLFDRATLGRYPVDELAHALNLSEVFTSTEVIHIPQVRLPAGGLAGPEPGYSPLQLALVAAAISAGGIQPAPVLVTAVKTPAAGWVPLPPLDEARRILPPATASRIAGSLAQTDPQIWQAMAVVKNLAGQTFTWLVGGTLPEWQGAPYALALLLEGDRLELAREIGRSLFLDALPP